VEALRNEQRGPGGGERLDDRRLRSGKVVSGHRANHGFRMNVARDAYEVDAAKMCVVRLILGMIASDELEAIRRRAEN
jgi:hypothetical protein